MAQEVEINIGALSSLELAYLGDAVYELEIRKYVLSRHGGEGVGADNKFAKQLCNAQSQAKIAMLLSDEMSEEETRVYKRGRNAKSLSAPRSCSISEYRRATGLEALFGSLYISGGEERIRELIKTGVERFFGGEESEHNKR